MTLVESMTCCLGTVLWHTLTADVLTSLIAQLNFDVCVIIWRLYVERAGGVEAPSYDCQLFCFEQSKHFI